MSELSEIEDDWRVLRRGVQDRIPVTMNVGEALSRITAAIWAFFQIEGDTDTFALGINNEYAKDVGLKYKVVLYGFKDKENIQLFDPVNKGGFHEDLETALEFAFSQVGAILSKFMEERLTAIKRDEDALNESKHVYRKLERNRREMGMYNPLQEPLPFPEAMPSVAAAS